jgi:hypothetical protein
MVRAITRRIPFIVCVAATVLAHHTEHHLLFGLSALSAFGNLFSSQFVCAFDACGVLTDSGSGGNPARIARIIYRATSVIGFMILIYALTTLDWQNG